MKLFNLTLVTDIVSDNHVYLIDTGVNNRYY